MWSKNNQEILEDPKNQNIIRAKTLIFRMLRKAEKEFEKQKEKIRMFKIHIQNYCSHDLIKYYPDPAGGFGSSYQCCVCDKEFYKKDIPDTSNVI